MHRAFGLALVVMGFGAAPLLAQTPSGCTAPAGWPALPSHAEIEQQPSFRITTVDSAHATSRDSADVRASIIPPQYAYYHGRTGDCEPVIVVQRYQRVLGYRAFLVHLSGVAPDTAFTLLGAAVPAR